MDKENQNGIGSKIRRKVFVRGYMNGTLEYSRNIEIPSIKCRIFDISLRLGQSA